MFDQLYVVIYDDNNGDVRLLSVEGPTTVYNAEGVKRFTELGFDVLGPFTPIYFLHDYDGELYVGGDRYFDSI
jgi:hypothetical protein